MGPREIGRVRRLAERALCDRLRTLKGDVFDRACRLTSERDALVDTLSDCARRHALEDVAQGDGSELRSPKDPTLQPRFHSSRSSCALAVNAFGLWRCDPSSLVVAGTDGFTELRFERKLPIAGCNGRIPPNLDVFAAGTAGNVAVESKLLEYMSLAPPPSISPAYATAIASLADESWRAQIEARGSGGFQFFRAGQIIKHYLGLKSARPASALLVYLHWEPLDHDQHPLFAQHRSEVDLFAAAVSDEAVTFVALTYAELFASWERLQRPDIGAHVAGLRERYDVSIFGS